MIVRSNPTQANYLEMKIIRNHLKQCSYHKGYRKLQSNSFKRYVFLYHSYIIRMSFVCHSISFVCHPYVTRMYSYVTSPVSYSYLLVCHSFVCHSDILVCHFYVIRLWFYHEPIQMRVFIFRTSLKTKISLLC